jgi:hypothetical protein
VWSGEIKGSSPAWTFFFFYGKFSWLFDFLNAKDYRDDRNRSYYGRAFAVRERKKQ